MGRVENGSWASCEIRIVMGGLRDRNSSYETSSEVRMIMRVSREVRAVLIERAVRNKRLFLGKL